MDTPPPGDADPAAGPHRRMNAAKPWQWRLECLVHSLVEGVAACLPGPVVFRLGAVLGGLACRMMPKRRASVLRNLRVAYAGEKSPDELRAMTREVFARAGANLVSAAHTARLRPDQLADALTITNVELLEQALAKGRGVVLLLAHMGNWELLSRIIHLFPPGSRTGAFYRPLNNVLLDQRVLARREADGTRMFSKRDPFHQVTGFLRGGGIVGILSDQRVGQQGALTRFFDRLTRATPLPALLARRAKAELLALSLVTVAPGRWQATFIAVDAPQDTASAMAALETAMRASPCDVFWMQERWRVYLSAEHPPREWLGEGGRSGKPHRALLWLAGTPPGWRPPGDWWHDDITYEAVLAEGAARPDWLPATMPLHRVGHDGGRAAMRRLLAAIDGTAALPLDFILAHAAAGDLLKAARSESLPVISLP